ncbi:phage tail length tape measure family protein [Rhizobium mesoamericanum]|uniref:phage tail length tape measure family protein n=1 Tax=Rhizobium mesoamericanum TaxID=1079800 RepID=UPI0003FB8937|nr:phage tail length tape measure family protein [Rhizobium mesoamericanum]
MADNDNNLVFTVSSDMSAAQRGLNKFVTDVGTSTAQIAKKFEAAGAQIDRSTTALQTRINGVVGLGTKATKEWTGALADQGKELEKLRAKYNPLFATARNYKESIAEIRRAHSLGAISSAEYQAAMSKERQAALASMAAIKGRNAAIAAAPKAAGANDNRLGSAFQTANIAAQFQDIGVTAAMGMNPLQIALQQGTQLSSVIQTMGSGRSALAGLGAALASLVSPISLVTIGLTAGAAAFIQFIAAGEGTDKTTALLEKQNEVLRAAADAWGEALPSVKAYVDELDRANAIQQGKEAGDILGAKELEGLGEKLQGLKRQFAEAMRGLKGIEADPAFIRDFGQAFGDLREKLDDGTAGVADYNRAQQILAEAVEKYGVKSVLGFRDAFDLITVSIRNSISASKEARSEWVRAVAGADNVQDITSGATWRDKDGTVRQTGSFTPAVGPMPQSRPLIELEGLPGSDKVQKTEETAAQKAANAYRDLLKAADDRIGQLQQEIELAGQYGVAADAARFRLDLLQQSEDKGRKLSAEQRAELEKKVALYEKYSDALSKVKLQQDLTSQARFNSLSKQDQQITTVLRQYGLSEDLNSNEAGQIRSSLRTEDLRGDIKSFAGDFKDALLNNGGDIGKAFADSIQRPLCGVERTININLGDFV